MSPAAHVLFPELSYAVQGCVFEVYRELGAGFAERVYHRAMSCELAKRGIRAESEKIFQVTYKDEIVGRFRPDIVVENRIVLELKSQTSLHGSAQAQMLSYLSASSLRLGMIVNFVYPRATIQRIVR